MLWKLIVFKCKENDKYEHVLKNQNRIENEK